MTRTSKPTSKRISKCSSRDLLAHRRPILVARAIFHAVFSASLLIGVTLRAQSVGQGGPTLAGQLPRVAVADSLAGSQVNAMTDVRPATRTASPESRVLGVPSAIAVGAPSADSARLVTAGSFTVFPFGHSQPVVTCTLLRACVIELEDGETIVNNPIAGDAVRWMIERARAGPDGRNALVVVKPRFCEITTNLVIPTDRRIYDLTLDSPPCSSRRGDAYKSSNELPKKLSYSRQYNPQQPYARHVRFSYPDDSSARLHAAGLGARSTGLREGAAPGGAVTGNGHDLVSDAVSGAMDHAVNRAYRIVRARRGPFGLFGHAPLDFPWTPAAMYDDGTHLYVELPPAARHQAVPVLYALERDGSRSLLNYTVQPTPSGDAVFVIDRVVPRAVLVLGGGSHEQRLVLENRAFGRTVSPDSAGQGRR